MASKPTTGKVKQAEAPADTENPVQASMPALSGIAVSVAESRRSSAVAALEADLTRIDREPLFSASGLPMPEHIRRQRMEGRQNVVDRIERLRGLSGYELVAEFAPQYLPRTEPQEEQVRFEETLRRGAYGPKAVNGAPVVMADPGHLANYRARMAEQAKQAEHEARVRRGREAIALAALAE
jgi:hypothetical protein